MDNEEKKYISSIEIDGETYEIKAKSAILKPLKIGNISYDGTQEVTIPVYEGTQN